MKEMLVKTFGIVGLVGQLKSGQINRDAEMQRSFVWGNKEQTDLIDSVFQALTTYIPPLIGAETEVEVEVKGKIEKVIDLLDGKQRSTTLERFLNDEIKLGHNIRPVVIENEDETVETYIVAGKKWSELPDKAKQVFKNCKIQMVYFKDMTQTERELQFIKLQGGKKLSNAEVNKVRIGSTVREFIYRQLATDLWTNKFINISANREVKFEAMQQVLMVMSNQFDLSGKSLQDFSEDSAMISEETMAQVESITEYLNEVVKLIKKSSLPIELQKLEESEATAKLEPKELKKYLRAIDYLKKVNVPIIYNTAHKAILNDVSAKDFSKFVSKFFENVSGKYKSKTEKGSAEASKVKERIELLNKDFMSEFKIVAKVAEVKVVEVQEVEPVIEQEGIIEEQWEQPQQTENLESTITVTPESFSENQEEQPEQTINDEQEQDQEFQEETQAILNIVNNVA